MPSDSDKSQPQPKDIFKYFGTAGQDVPRFDPALNLPPSVTPQPRLVANLGLGKIPVAPVDSLELLGIVGVAPIIYKLGLSTVMPANLTRCRPDKFSDDFFVERRLNGFNPGQMKRVENQPWQYIICYDCSKHEFTLKPGSIFPHFIEARFVLCDRSLKVHSIEYELIKGVKILKSTGDPIAEWEWAKQLFRCAEIVFQESQSHLGHTHLNVEQYAMAYYRNIVNNPIKLLLEPHFEGLINVNKLGSSNIFGTDGIIPQASALYYEQVSLLIREAVSELNYHNWHPNLQKIPDEVANNFFDPAALAVWEAITKYVTDFFARQVTQIQQLWSEVEDMSEDLTDHSILKEQHGTLAIANIDELKQLCIYVIYHSSFLHSWLNYKQYEDVGDVEYAAMGLWDQDYPDYKSLKVPQKHIRQVLLAWTLSQIRYNPILGEANSDSLIAGLKSLLWQRRDQITPGLPLEILMSSIHV